MYAWASTHLWVCNTVGVWLWTKVVFKIALALFSRKWCMLPIIFFDKADLLEEDRNSYVISQFFVLCGVHCKCQTIMGDYVWKVTFLNKPALFQDYTSSITIMYDMLNSLQVSNLIRSRANDLYYHIKLQKITKASANICINSIAVICSNIVTGARNTFHCRKDRTSDITK